MKHDEDFEANLAGEDGQSEESKTSWFKRIKKGILTSTAEKKGNTGRSMEQVSGLWFYLYRYRAPRTHLRLSQMQLSS